MVTLFGDVVNQQGGWISLSSLIHTLDAFGYTERSVRSAVYRLAKDDWLKSQKNGRKSDYAITECAAKHFQKAAKRIYTRQPPPQEETWLFLIPSFVNVNQLPALKRQLKWLGFSPLTRGVYAHPQCAQQMLEDTIDELGLKNSVVIFCGKSLDSHSDQVLKKLVYEKWQLQKIAAAYGSFISIYQPLLSAETCHAIEPQSAFMLRLLLIHEYRRIVLKDHQLNSHMLPKDWPAAQARELTAELYLGLISSSCDFIQQSLTAMDDKLPPPDKQFYQRFHFDR